MAKTKTKLSAEELHKIRSEASKKGWETRRANALKQELGYEEIPQETTSTTIDTDEVFNSVVLTINENIPYEDVAFFTNTSHKQRIAVDTNNWRDYLINMLYDKIYETKDEDLKSLADHYIKYQDTLKTALQHAFIPSNTIEEAKGYIREAAEIINANTLDMSQLSELGNVLDNQGY